jgi:hypothetical protein
MKAENAKSERNKPVKRGLREEVPASDTKGVKRLLKNFAARAMLMKNKKATGK